MSINDDRIERLTNGTFTQEDFDWGLNVIKKSHQKRQRTNEKKKVARVPEGFDPVDYTLVIRERSEDLRLYISEDFVLLESYGVPVATYKDGKYFRITVSDAEPRMSKHIHKFMSVHSDIVPESRRFPEEVFRQAYDKLDRSKTRVHMFRRSNAAFWEH